MHVSHRFGIMPLLIVGSCAALQIFLSEPASARERKVIQRSQTNAQAKAADLYIAEDAPEMNFGTAPVLQVEGGKGRIHKRSLVLFDFSGISSAGIKRAILTLHIRDTSLGEERLSVHRVTSLYGEKDATWQTRIAGLPWGSTGGDFIGQPTAVAVIGPTSLTASWDVTSDVQSWFNSTPNYGMLVRELYENQSGARATFASMEFPLESERPNLDLVFVQNVNALRAEAGNESVKLLWSYPSPAGEVLEPNVGVLVLRSAGHPVAESALPADGIDPGLCATLGSATVVFDDFASATSFLDDSSDPCGAPTNDTTWFYRVFARDAANFYSYGGSARSSSAPEAVGTPSRVLPQAPLWISATHAAELTAPSLSPGNAVMVGSSSRLLFRYQPRNGVQDYLPISLGASVAGRSSLIDAQDSSTGRRVLYVSDSSGLSYAADADSGELVWITNPTNSTATRFGAPGAVWVKSFGGPGYRRDTDLVITGTRNVNAPRENEIVAVDGNTGRTAWRIIGNAGSAPGLDIITSTPWVDYTHNSVWVTSRSAGSATQPSLWKLDPNNGEILATLNLGDIDSSPTMTPQAEVLFVGNNHGMLYAIDPVSSQVLASYRISDGPIKGFPLVANFASPYQVVISASSKVQMVTFDVKTRAFTRNWRSAILQPSTPIGFVDVGRVYVGAGDGNLHELDLATGRDLNQRILNPMRSVIVGDPSLDIVLSRIYVTASDGRVYAFSYPF